jgi:hypothetical protein
MKKLLLIITASILYSCAPIISTTSVQKYSPLNMQDNIIIYQQNATLPPDIKIIGKTEIKDSGFSVNCGFDVVLEKVKNEARKIGANAIVITEHLLPSIWGSSCHRIKANLGKTGAQEVVTQNNVQKDTITKLVVAVSPESKNVKNAITYNKYFLTANYGLGFRTASADKTLSQLEQNFQKNLSSGNSLLLKAGYRPSENNYYGFTYSQFSSSGSLRNVTYTEPNGSQGAGSIGQTNTINFYGLTAGWSLSGFSRRDTVCFDLSLGYITYSEKLKFSATYEATGGNLGIATDLSYYIGLTKNIKIGPTFSFSGGALKKYSINGNNGFSSTFKYDENSFLSLYRVDLMIGTYIEF